MIGGGRAEAVKWPDLSPLKGLIEKVVPVAQINDKIILNVPKVDDPKIGKSKSAPFALRINVGPNATGFPAGIGKVVHNALFSAYPRFVFKVAFAAAETDLLGRGNYANPASIWYNVFFGFYEIVVPAKAWGRPFGYADATSSAKVRFEDIVRIGKADWNHFSNELYGVPAAAIRAFDAVDMSRIETPPVERRKVGARKWDLVNLNGLSVVGPARSTRDGKGFVDRSAIVGKLWRYVFGTSAPTSKVRKSFAETKMRGRFYISFKADNEGGEAVYKTWMFGGTVNEGYPDKAENERFLGLQMRSIEEIMAREKGIGFPE